MARWFGLRNKERAEVVRDSYEDRKARRWVENTLKVPLHRFADVNAYLEVGYKRVWASFRACHITASVLLSTQFRLVGKNTGADVDSPDLAKLMSMLNPWDSWEEALYLWVFHMKLTGSAFWYKDEMDYRGRPRAIYPLLPQYVKIVPDPATRIEKYIYSVNGHSIDFQPDEIIHFRRPHPAKLMEGLGDVAPGEELFRDYIMRNDLQTKFLENGATPSGVLTRKEEVGDQAEWEKFKAWWDRTYGGKRNAGKTAFLNGEWSYHKLGLTQTEMQSIESEKWSIEQIFTCHGVPLSMAGIVGASNYATAKIDEINFRRYEVVPLLDLLVGRLNGAGAMASLIPAYSPQWRLDYDLAGLIDIEQTVKDYRPLVDLGGMTLNQLRVMCGLPRDEANPLLDQYFVNAGRIPIELAGFGGGSSQNGNSNA